MPELHIEISQHTSTYGSAAERAAFGQLEVSVRGETLTGLLSQVAGGHNPEHSWGPYVSGYHLAEWFATHWWRLRWEPSRRWAPREYLSNEEYTWDLAHKMSAIGEGYIWPNITFNCDGYLCEVVSERTIDKSTPIEYLGAKKAHVSAGAWECAVDQFVSHVLSLLDDANLPDTELHAIWKELNDERDDAGLSAYRRIEALLGFDVDEGEEAYIEAAVRDAEELGTEAINELATGTGRDRMSASDIRSVSDTAGFAVNPKDGVSFSPSNLPEVSPWGQVDAWRIGKQFAHSIRQEASLSEGPVSNKALASLAGTSPSTIEHVASSVPISWVYAPDGAQARVVLRGRSTTGRRFDMARVVGDQVFGHARCVSDEPLSPATRSYSYRQKAQRAFAAELLCPWHAIEGYFEDGFDDDSIDQVAARFQVSERVVENVLDNNRIDG